MTKLDQNYVQKYLSDPNGIEKLIQDKQAFVQEHGSELYNHYLALCLHRQRANTVTSSTKEKST